MARSNSFNYNLTRDELLFHAYIEAGLKAESESLSAAEIVRGSSILNWIVKSWSGEAVKLWKRKQATLFTEYSTNTYSLGSTGDNATNNYIKTTLSSTEAAGQTILSVTSSTGMTAGDYIGIKLDDGTRQWTTIVSVDSAVQITVTNALTSEASANNTVVSYTTKIYRPLRLILANKYDLVTNAETQIKLISYDTYFNTPLKTILGDPNNAYYDKQLDNGILYLYPTPSNVDMIIKFVYHEPIMDMDSATDDFDLPSEWYWTLIVNIALELARSKGNAEKVQALEPIAVKSLEQMKCFDSDTENLRFNMRSRRIRR